MTRAPALLLVQLQPPPELTGEFHDWYDTEHVPERARIPGFLTTVRLVCPDGWPAYAGYYDLDHVGILDEPPYRSISGKGASAWTRRLLPRMTGYDRLLLEQTSAGGGPLPAEHRGVAVLRFDGDAPEPAGRGADLLAQDVPGGRSRVFRRLEAPAPETAVVFDAPALDLIPRWLPAELALAFGDLTKGLKGVWRYARYWRQGA